MQLYINKAGSSVSVREGNLVVKTPESEQSLPLGTVESIFVNRSVHLTGEVLWKAVENDIDLQLVDRTGKPVARLWSNKFGSIAIVRRQQLRFSESTQATVWVAQLLATKVEQQAMHLRMWEEPSNAHWLRPLVEQLEQMKGKLAAVEEKPLVEVEASLRGYEAQAGRVYFQSVSKLLPDQYQFERRSQHPAEDMYNALLNYAYGMLYGKVEESLLKAGVDPSIGIFHKDEYNRPVLVYDFIERYRVWADFVVTNLCMQQVYFREFFEVEKGAYWLGDSGKRILIQTMVDYLDEVVSINGMERSRGTHIFLAAQQFATFLKNGNFGA